MTFSRNPAHMTQITVPGVARPTFPIQSSSTSTSTSHLIYNGLTATSTQPTQQNERPSTSQHAYETGPANASGGMPRPRRQSPKTVKNLRGVKKEVAPKPIVSSALKKAIDTMDHMRLRLWVKHYCEIMEPIRADLEKSLVVLGKDLIRYHTHSASEDDEYSENESTEEEEDEEDSDSDGDRKSKKRLKPIAVADDEMLPRYALCMNCKVSDFDVTANDRGDCRWHPSTSFHSCVNHTLELMYVQGRKEADYDDDFWDDHDEQCGGNIDSLVDEPDYAYEFKWSCCNETADDEGCKSTRHKSDTNIIVKKPTRRGPTSLSRKRKTVKEFGKPIYKRCQNCEERFDINDNDDRVCVYHLGELEDDRMTWSCCKAESDDPGCMEERHEA
jgi:hypothetical protein